MRFEDRLTALIASFTLITSTGCVGGGDSDTTTTTKDSGTTDSSTPPLDLEAICDGGAAPEGYSVYTGFVEVAVGEACPEVADAQIQAHGCTFQEWQGVTCVFVRKDSNQVYVDDGYGGYYTSADDVPTGYPTEPVVDVCYFDGVFYQDPNHPTCGRPLLDDAGQAITAPVHARDHAWAPPSPCPPLTAEARHALGDYWLACARMEHASVASFSVFSLDLLRIGAPPELLEAAHRAALDEIHHARLCFGLAGRYRSEALGPDVMKIPALAERSWEVILAALIREGCVGEAVAAVDAAARLARVTDPEVHEVLTVITRDEAAHAALAWRTLGWWLRQKPELRAHAEAVFADERAKVPGAVSGATASLAEAHGLLGAAEQARARLSAWEQVIEPSWRGLAAQG